MAGAGALYVVALAGQSVAWLVALVGTLFLLTLGFFCMTRPLARAPARSMEIPDFARQGEFDVRCEWAGEGLAAVARDADAIVIVDVLSFTTSVDLVVSNAGIVLPFSWRDRSAADFARQHDAHLAGENEFGWSLRPSSLESIPPGIRLVMPSPNGSALSVLCEGAATFAACLRNASAVARAAARVGPRVAVIPSGERWDGGPLRPCFEDLCGAGAVISALPGSRSPEARMAEDCWHAARHDLLERLQACASGREKIEGNLARDVELAAAVDVSRCVPRLDAGAFRDAAEGQ